MPFSSMPFGRVVLIVRRVGASIAGRDQVGSRPAAVEALESRRLLSNGYTYEPVAAFSSADTVGSAPGGQMAIDKSGDLYGFTSAGGANSTGAAYEVQPGNSTPILLASFPAAASGTSFVATGPVVDSVGDLFGVTEAGGDANQDGTVFEIAHGSGAVTTLAMFDSATTGSSPGGNLVIDSAGDVFGTTANGGANGCGTVWEFPKGGSAIIALASFSPVTVGGVGQNPGANAIAFDPSGNIYGTTSGNAAVGSDGTVWELPNGTATIQTLASFNGTNGITPVGGVAVDGKGNVYGVTEYGGDDIASTGAPMGSGVAWELPSGLGQIEPLADFDDPSVGQFPLGGVVLDQRGDLFGTTSAGGNTSASLAGDGTVWEVPGQTVSPRTIETFNGTDGSTPRGGLVVDAVGNVFGTTSGGGADSAGAVFEMDLGGASSSATSLSPLVVRSTLPANVAAGVSAHGTATVDLSNSTKTAVRGVFTIAVYASSDGAIDGSAIKLTSLSRKLVLGAKGKTAISLAIPKFRTNTTGSYTLLAQVTNDAGNTSSAATGPVITVAPPVISFSETITRIKLPTALPSGGKVRGDIVLKIHNGGNITSTGATKINLGLAPVGSSVAAAQIVLLSRRLAIAAGSSATLTVPIAAIPAGLNGSYNLIVQVTDSVGGASSVSSSSTYTLSPA
jgi:uncharacterized repeat protein (TIGR03803 family)